ncbi:MAG: hypothetical protein M3450_16640 [Actinomycetota bacterium]|nr:hypothetical protein [Actinomycetota bacterium]
MTKRSKSRRVVAVLTIAALGGLANWATTAAAHTDPKPYGITPLFQQAVVVEDPIRINTRRGTQVTTTRLSVAPGGHTPWHYHPGPHVVAVTVGTVTVYETDCTERGVFSAGGGFFDPGSAKPRHIHTLYNPGPATAEVVITDFRDDGRVLTVPADPQPTDCW